MQCNHFSCLVDCHYKANSELKWIKINFDKMLLDWTIRLFKLWYTIFKKPSTTPSKGHFPMLTSTFDPDLLDTSALSTDAITSSTNPFTGSCNRVLARTSIPSGSWAWQVGMVTRLAILSIKQLQGIVKFTPFETSNSLRFIFRNSPLTQKTLIQDF